MQDHLLLQEKFKLALGIDLDRLIRPSAVEQTMREAMEERRRSEELLAGPARQLQKQLKEIAPVIGASSAWTRAMEENARAFEQARDRMMGLGATVRIPDLLCGSTS